MFWDDDEWISNCMQKDSQARHRSVPSSFQEEFDLYLKESELPAGWQTCHQQLLRHQSVEISADWRERQDWTLTLQVWWKVRGQKDENSKVWLVLTSSDIYILTVQEFRTGRREASNRTHWTSEAPPCFSTRMGLPDTHKAAVREVTECRMPCETFDFDVCIKSIGIQN